MPSPVQIDSITCMTSLDYLLKKNFELTFDIFFRFTNVVFEVKGRVLKGLNSIDFSVMFRNCFLFLNKNNLFCTTFGFCPIMQPK